MNGRSVLRFFLILAVVALVSNTYSTFLWYKRNVYSTIVHNEPVKQGKASVLSSSPKEYPTVRFLSVPNVKEEKSDHYAASWWQTKERFVMANVKDIEYLEEATFLPVANAGRGVNDIRMALDWLDFSVEHLSKWWRVAYDGNGNEIVVAKLNAYVKKTMRRKRLSWMKSTLAILPFGLSKKDHEERQILLVSLAATMASLVQLGVARVVVVGHTRSAAGVAASTFSMLSQQYIAPASQFSIHIEQENDDPAKIELAYVHRKDVNSTYEKLNVPKGALVGLKEALLGIGDQVQAYLGNHSNEDFKYIYFSEPDQILNARITPAFLEELDDGRILIPHRLQPIPHELDNVQPRPDLRLPPPKTVHDLNAETDACCDTGEHVNKPKLCPQFWWLCGMIFSEDQGGGNFDHLEGYEYMRLLQGGTGIVSLTSTEHSRRCQPVKNGRGCLSAVDEIK